jgi:hypothetical protein
MQTEQSNPDREPRDGDGALAMKQPAVASERKFEQAERRKDALRHDAKEANKAEGEMKSREYRVVYRRFRSRRL